MRERNDEERNEMHRNKKEEGGVEMGIWIEHFFCLLSKQVKI